MFPKITNDYLNYTFLGEMWKISGLISLIYFLEFK